MVLLVIDVQKGITDDRLYNFKGFINNLKLLTGKAREQGVEVIYVQHDDGPGTGFSIGDADFEIYDEVAPFSGEKIFYKTVNSSFSNKDLCKYLEDKKEDTVVISGLMTNFCIDATVKSAFDRGYKVIIPKGCNTTSSNDYMDAETTYRYYNEMMWPERFAECIEISEVFDRKCANLKMCIL